MADQDRFIVDMIAVGYPNQYGINALLGDMLRHTQLDFSHYRMAPFNGVAFNGETYGTTPEGWPAELISVTADDVFQGNDADIQTVKNIFDATMEQFFNAWDSQITSSRIIPAHQVATNVNPNTGHIVTNSVAPQSPNNAANKNWFDRTFFTGAGALTGVGIGVLVVLGAIVVTQSRR